MSVLAVYRHKEFGLEERDEQLDLLATRVAGYVQILRGVVHNADTVTYERVDDLTDELLVAGNGRGGEDYNVGGADPHLIMLGEGDTVERGHRLALATRGDDGDLLGAVSLHIRDVDEHSVGQIHVVELGRRTDDVDHTSTKDDDLAVVLSAGIDYLLYSVYVGGEGRDDDSLILVLREESVKAVAHRSLRGGKAGALRVGGLTHQESDTFLTNLTNAGKIHHLAVDRRDVELKVARMVHHADRSLDGYSTRVRDGVIHVDELRLEDTEVDDVARLHGVELGEVRRGILVELTLDDTE